MTANTIDNSRPDVGTYHGASSPIGVAESASQAESAGNESQPLHPRGATPCKSTSGAQRGMRGSSDDDEQWYVLRDLKRANALKPAYKLLPSLGFEIFTPMRWVLKESGGKRTRLYIPFIPSLLFAKASRSRLDEIVRQTPTLQYRFVKGAPQGTPMTVPTDEMTRFIKAVAQSNNCTFYTPDEITPDMIGRMVLIKGGPFDGHIGPLLRTRGTRKRRLIINLQGLITAAIEISPEYIQLL